MSPTMRAKFQVSLVQENFYPGPVREGEKSSETLKFQAVGAPEYPADGSCEDSTFSRFTPSADLSMSVTNPDLFGKFKVGDKFYADFTPAP